MRDILLVALLPFLLIALIKRPFVAVGLWAWTALFFPNYWVFGFSSSIRFNLLFSLGAILSYLFHIQKIKEKTNLQLTGWLVIIFLFWSLISSAFTIGLFDVSFEYWIRFAKVVMLFLFILFVLRTKLHLDFFLWCLILSVGAYGAFEGVKFIITGGSHKIAGMNGHILGDRNNLAVALVMLIPICIYFIRSDYSKNSKIVKLGFQGLILLLIFSILGTNSRGGLISLLFLGAYFLSQAKNKIIYIIVASFVIGISLQMVPDEWFQRMNTIEAADQDKSFMGRVVAWKLSLMIALENPIFGGGMKSLENLGVWQYFSYQFHLGYLSWFYTGSEVPQPIGRAAHSIYFQVLGEQGFGGLFIFLSIITTSIFRANRVQKHVDAEPWMKDMAKMLKLSILSFMIGGAALSFAYYDALFAIIALLILIENRLINSLGSK